MRNQDNMLQDWEARIEDLELENKALESSWHRAIRHKESAYKKIIEREERIEDLLYDLTQLKNKIKEQEKMIDSLKEENKKLQGECCLIKEQEILKETNENKRARTTEESPADA